jgi:hypothetical protein
MWPPAFNCPIPAAISVEAEQGRARGLRWALESGLVRDATQAEQLDQARFDRLAAMAYPGALGAELDLAVGWMLWFFEFDDWFDGPAGTDVHAVDELLDRMVAMMYGAAPRAAGDHPLVRVFLDLCERSRIGMTPSWQGRFHSDAEVYLRSYRWEAVNRAQARLSDVETYLEVRRHSIGIWMSLDLAERVSSMELPHQVFRSECIQRMRRLCSNHVVLVNEIASFGKDRAGMDCNVLSLLEASGGPVGRDAVTWVRERADEQLAEFLDLQRSLPVLCDRMNLPAASLPAVVESGRAMASWIRANLDWSLETPRYLRHVPEHWVEGS